MKHRLELGEKGAPSHIGASLNLSFRVLRLVMDNGLSERSAFAKAVTTMKGNPRGALRAGFLLSVETIRRLNLIDTCLSRRGIDLDSLTTDQKNCVRVFTYWTHFRRSPKGSIDHFLKACRRILMPEDVSILEEIFGMAMILNLDEIVRIAGYEKSLALRYCVPDWYVPYLHRWFGWKEAGLILHSYMCKPTTYVRLNTLKAEEPEIKSKLEAEGAQVQPTPLKWAYMIHGGKPLYSTEAYRNGLIEIQDLSSIAVAEAVCPRPGSRVLEIGAAPGCKTGHLVQLMDNRGEIYSIDISSKRMHVWLKSKNRLRLTIAEPVVADGSRELPLTKEMDHVLLDAPCSNTGVLHKTPRLKWKLAKSDIWRYSRIQSEILRQAASHVKAGGDLVYSTCSIAPEENELVVEEFLRRNAEFHLGEVSLPIGIPGMRALEKSRRLFSHLHGCNGAFIAKLLRST